MERFSEVARKTKEYGMQLRGTVSCAFGFYGDTVTLEDVTDVVANFRELDCDDTIPIPFNVDDLAIEIGHAKRARLFAEGLH